MRIKSSVKGRITLPLLYKLYKNHRLAVAELVEKHGRNFALRGIINNIHFFTDPKFIEWVLYAKNLNYPRAPNPLFDRLDNPSGSLDRETIRDRWRKCRSNMLNTAFTESAVKKYTETIVPETSGHIEEWINTYKGGQTLFPYHLVQRLAVENLRKGLLGNVNLDVDDFIATIDEFATLELKYELSITKLAWKFPTPTLSRTKAVMQKLADIHDVIINHCLSDEAKDVVIFKDIVKAYKAEYKAGNDDKDLRTFLHSICGIYTIAGFDSLSHALPVTFAYLSQYPDIAKKVRAEVNTVVGNGKITPENIESLVYTRAVFLESLRLSGGIFPLLIRQASADDNIDGYVVKKGDRIIIPVPYMTHRPEYWENPEGFDPTRFFTINTTDERYRYVHLTFGAGLNGCLGRHFAVLQSTIILAMAMQKFRLDLLPYQDIDPDKPQKIAMKLILDSANTA